MRRLLCDYRWNDCYLTMTMTTSPSVQTLLHIARHRVLVYALRRAETPIMLGVGVGLATLSFIGVLPLGTWAMWPLISVLGVAAMVATAFRANRYLREFASEAFYQQFDAERLRLPELKRGMADALNVHRNIIFAMASRPDAPLGGVAETVDAWVMQTYRLAESLDAFITNDVVIEQITQLVAPAREASANTSRIQAFALMELKGTDAELLGARGILLTRIKDTITSANQQLSLALITMGDIHSHLRTLKQTELSRDYAERTTFEIATQCTRMYETDQLIRELFSDCVVAGEQTVHEHV